jgi:hypothetical protein
MEDGEEDHRMLPNSTQNLNAKLSPSLATPQRLGTGITLGAPPIQTYAPPVRIVSASTRYRGGGYHLERLAS